MDILINKAYIEYTDIWLTSSPFLDHIVYGWPPTTMIHSLHFLDKHAYFNMQPSSHILKIKIP